MSDTELIGKLRNGILEAFVAVHAMYSNRLYRFALKYLKSKEEAEGLVQDVFLKLRENRKNLKKETSLKSYLLTISYHNICKFLRNKQLPGNLNDELIGHDFYCEYKRAGWLYFNYIDVTFNKNQVLM